ncbi:MAG: type II secretion system protein E [Desulfuromonas sp.]|nr:MAG: type II secretion system protein E [Desulfuromonas sp.]
MKHPLILKYLDGRSVDATLLSAFHPRQKSIQAELTSSGKVAHIPLESLCYVMIMAQGEWQIPSSPDEKVEHIETVTGESFKMRVSPKQEYPSGVLAFPVRKDTEYRNIFFTINGIRQRNEDRHLTEILEEGGVIEENDVKKVLAEQQKLRTRKVGEILTEEQGVAPEKLEKTIQDAANKLSPNAKFRVGDLLIEAGLVTREQVETALESQTKGKKKRIGELLIENGLITEEQLLAALSAKFRMRQVDLESLEPTKRALDALNKTMVNQLKAFPVSLERNVLTVATSDPTNHTIGDTLRFSTSYVVEFVTAPATKIQEAIDKFYAQESAQLDESISDLIGDMDEDDIDIQDTEDVSDYKITEKDSQIITLVNRVLLDGYNKGVSDIHFEPGHGQKPLQIRYRIDGICDVAHQVSHKFKKAIISRLKIISQLDIAERRRPQSGKILMRSGNKKIEFRVEITPTTGGLEDAVLRILSSSKPLKLEQMGFSEQNLESFRGMLSTPYGIVLCVGPTGSGKTTTLHSALGHINTPDRKIWTAEDPVEITQAGLRQVQIQPKINFNFPEALRSFLRADPDVIMIGEMRDAETAKIAIEASLTGHMVFTTLHTNSAAETVVRLIEMGMDPFNFANAMVGILAQRLARRLCPDCREPYHPSITELGELVQAYGKEYYQKHELPRNPEEITLYRKQGCEKCGQTGYRGRIAIHELMATSEVIRRAIKDNLALEDIRDLAIDDGMCTLKMDGIKKILQGQTDLQQILRVCA